MASKTPEFYLISTAAELLDMHPQTLRKYERLGLVSPPRTLGSMRVYTSGELDRLRLIKAFVDRDGINLAGVHRLLSIVDVLRRLRPLVDNDESGSPPSPDVQHQVADEVATLFRLLGLGDSRR